MPLRARTATCRPRSMVELQHIVCKNLSPTHCPSRPRFPSIEVNTILMYFRALLLVGHEFEAQRVVAPDKILRAGHGDETVAAELTENRLRNCHVCHVIISGVGSISGNVLRPADVMDTRSLHGPITHDIYT